MQPMRKQIYLVASILLASVRVTLSAKTNARPVYEVINEQARIDDNIRISNSPDTLPYGNPFAGNSQQNARRHFNNQQAMFNAERMRQLTAQLQRQAKGPKLIDSYMQAYHESQDDHQLVLEQQQATLRDDTHGQRSKQSPIQTQRLPQSNAMTKRVINRNENRARIVKNSYGSRNQQSESSSKVLPLQSSESLRPLKLDTSSKDVRYRSQRSYGSVDYYQYLDPKKYKTVYISPAPTYDQGVTIKPNGNIGFAADETREQNKLFTEAVPSNVKYVYPKQFNQMQNYKSIQETDQFKPILAPNTQEHRTEFNSLFYPIKDENNQLPIDIYFYLKNPSQAITAHHEQYRYAQLANAYTGNYNVPENTIKDYTPITEEVDDIEDPNAKNPKAYTPLPPQTPSLKEQNENTINNNIYKVKDVIQSIYSDEQENKQEDKPTYQALHYHQPHHEEENESYYHRNAAQAGVQQLSENGIGVSAYGDDLQYAANYEFGYRVHDEDGGNYFGHSEAKNGESTNGHYHVLLPDGRMQKVKYSAGPEGFHADISYDHLQ